ncbi:MAG TPA: hypothetical protein VGQ83_27065 [Polyangia bacterium]
MSRRAAALVLAAAASLAGCAPELSLEADPQPIPFDLISGVPISVAVIPGREPFHMLVDTASPISAIDLHGQSPGIEQVSELRLLRPDDPRVVRAILHDFGVARTPLYQAGFGTPVAVAGVLGGDVLAHYSVRFDYPAGGATMTFTERTFDEAKPETDAELAQAGRVVVRSFVLGGGTYELGDTAGSLSPTRMTVPACALLGGRAEDMLLLVATGFGPLTLGRSAAERIFARSVGTAEVDRLYVPGTLGGIAVLERGTLLGPEASALALVGDEHGDTPQSSSDFGGPCTQLFRHQSFEPLSAAAAADCSTGPCVGPGPNGSVVGAAYVELCASAPPIGYAVIADEEPLLQSLRAELRPQLPEIDGFAGTEVLRSLTTELNYRNSRVILDCAAGPDGAPVAGCRARPRYNFTGAPDPCRTSSAAVP